MADFIPRRESELTAWADNFVTWVGEYAGDLDIPAAEINKLKIAVNFFKSTLEQARSPDRTPVIIATKNGAKRDMVAKIRAMVRFRLQNPAVTDAMRIQLGLRARDTIMTAIPVPTTRPEFSFRVRDLRRVQVRFQDQGSDTRARPYGTNGAVISYDILDGPPADPGHLTRTTLATRTPYTLEFTEEERGRTLYAALQWQNEKGERGPWSEIQSAVIP
ncbi:MAG: hypothetical protein LBB81_10650 [Treponema sp.]|jgi:hypothetical protein|nr:hypothetical protein [Treponema sp.]